MPSHARLQARSRGWQQSVTGHHPDSLPDRGGRTCSGRTPDTPPNNPDDSRTYAGQDPDIACRPPLDTPRPVTGHDPDRGRTSPGHHRTRPDSTRTPPRQVSCIRDAVPNGSRTPKCDADPLLVRDIEPRGPRNKDERSGRCRGEPGPAGSATGVPPDSGEDVRRRASREESRSKLGKREQC